MEQLLRDAALQCGPCHSSTPAPFHDALQALRAASRGGMREWTSGQPPFERRSRDGWPTVRCDGEDVVDRPDAPGRRLDDRSRRAVDGGRGRGGGGAGLPRQWNGVRAGRRAELRGLLSRLQRENAEARPATFRLRSAARQTLPPRSQLLSWLFLRPSALQDTAAERP